MNEMVSSFIGLVVALLFVFFAPEIAARLTLYFRIKKYNKTNVEHQLDEKTSFADYQNRLNFWLLEMFCDEKKGKDINEK